MKTKNIFLLAFAAMSSGVYGQGVFIYDQQSSTESLTGEGGGIIQSNQPIGQSFTPALSSINFVRFQFADPNWGNGLGATVSVNLRSDSITGPILASTDPVFMPDSFGVGNSAGYTNFFISSPAPLSPGSTYYLQPILQSGDQSWFITDNVFNYPSGTAFFKGIASSTFYLWFREGIYVVPEPSSLSLVIGSGVLFYVRHKKNQKRAVR
jgi:hypothetical protein